VLPAGAGFAELGGRAGDGERGREIRQVERGKHDCDRERPLLRAEQRLVQIRVERRELGGRRLLGQLGVRPEAFERTVFWRIRSHQSDDIVLQKRSTAGLQERQVQEIVLVTFISAHLRSCTLQCLISD
jgi:hypothetical protein